MAKPSGDHPPEERRLAHLIMRHYEGFLNKSRRDGPGGWGGGSASAGRPVLPKRPPPQIDGEDKKDIPPPS